MCLAVPMRIVELSRNIAIAELGGVRREVNVELLEEACIGDYVIVHAGFAIQKLDCKEAEETLRLLEQISEGKKIGTGPIFK